MVVLRPDLGPRRAHGDVRMGTGEVTLHPGELATVAKNFPGGSFGGARHGAVTLTRVSDGMEMEYFDQADLCLAPANSNQQSTASSNPAGTAPTSAQPMTGVQQMTGVRVEAVPQTLDALLTTTKLDHVRAAIVDMGVAEVGDFADVTDEDLQECGLKKIEINRLRRHLAA
jgi:hypothetical protein